jgi:hypothetical protein
MPSTFVEHAVVPDASRTRLLVVVGDGRPQLPSWSLVEPEPADTIREARARFEVTSPFLRLLRMDGDPFAGEDVNTLYEFGALPADWVQRPGMDWRPVDEIAALDGGVAAFVAPLSAWAEELRSGTTPPLRAAWARPGWHEATVAWLTRDLARLGIEATGPVVQLGSWAISSLIAVETTAGRVVLKSVPPLFGHEPELTRALAAEHPGAVPRVLATEPGRGHLLMASFGGAPLGADEPHRWGDGLRQIAAIQRAWIGRSEDARRIGVDDRSLVALDAELDSIVTDESASPDLSAEARGRLVDLLPRYHALIAELQAGPVPETLVHGDFHPWNVQRDGDRLVIYDWSDAFWGHPFFDVATFTQRTEDQEARESMRTAYLDAWADHADARTLRALLASAEVLTELHLSISWRRLQAVFEPDGAYPFVVSGVRRHLESALAATPQDLA